MNVFSVISNSSIITEYISSRVLTDDFVYTTWHEINQYSLSFTSNQPNLILVDVLSYRVDAPELIKHLIQRYSCKILLLYQNGFEDLIIPCIMAGANGAIEHNQINEQLSTAMTKTLSGEVWLDRETTARVFVEMTQRPNNGDDRPKSLLDTLTKKELTVAKSAVLFAELPLKQLAMRMNIAESTLRNHLANIYKKLAVGNRTGLIIFDKQTNFSKLEYDPLLILNA